MHLIRYALLASLSAATPAFAADLAPQPVEPIAPIAAPFSWTGFYAGLHAGYGGARERDNQSHLFPQCPPPKIFSGGQCITIADRFNLNGFVGGAHAGYNYQFSSQFVIGAEADIDYTDFKKSLPYSYTAGAFTGRYNFRTDLQGSARLRAGYAFDRLLIYATGGIAFADAKLTTDGGSNSNTHVGWTVGLGTEYAIDDHWIVRAEVRYTDFSKESYDTLHGRVKAGWDQTTGDLGISYKF